MTTTAPSPICDAYSNGCVTPPPRGEATVSTPAPKPSLPYTGASIEVGTLILLALLLLLVGTAALVLAKRRRA